MSGKAGEKDTNQIKLEWNGRMYGNVQIGKGVIVVPE